MGPKGEPGLAGHRGPTGRPGKRGKQVWIPGLTGSGVGVWGAEWVRDLLGTQSGLQHPLGWGAGHLGSLGELSLRGMGWNAQN